MTNCVRIQAVSTKKARLLVMEAEGSEDAIVALTAVALTFVTGWPSDRGPASQPAIAPPKKPRRRHP